MRKARIILLGLLLITTVFKVESQTYSPKRVLAITQEKDKIRITYDNGLGEITFHTDNVVHYTFFPEYKSGMLPGYGIKPSPAVVDVKLDKEPWEKNYRYKTKDMQVDIHAFTGVIKYKDAEGNAFLETDELSMIPTNVQGEETFKTELSFKAPSDEHYFGLGQHQSGWMDHRGKTVQLWQDYEYEDGSVVAIPFMLTNKNYAVVYDNPSRTKVSCGIDEKTTWRSEMSQAVSYYVIYGKTTNDIYRNYGDLCGFAPLPPKKSFGYIQCKQKYVTQKEVLEVAKKHKAKGYPIDYMIVDWFHWDVLGDMDMNKERWPNPTQMNKELKDMDINCMISCWPRFKSESKNFDILNKNGWLMTDKTGRPMNGTAWDNRGALIDNTNSDAANWYWNTIRDNYTSKGFDSYWLDESEPDVVPYNYYLYKGLGAKVYNIYPYFHAKGVYTGHRRDLEERVFLLTRSAWLGTHQFGTAFWSSDIYAEWDVLERQVSAGVNFCASGMPYWSSDIGGWHSFQRDRKAPDAKRLLTSDVGPDKMNVNYPDYPEMYVRWFQYGTFCPTFRAHGSRSVNEVWSYGEEVEKILVKYLELRYNLLPYIYSNARKATTDNTPLMRGLWIDFMKDEEVMDIKDEYLFGSSILVAPVVKPGVESRHVYLPKGSDWYDIRTNKKYSGGTKIKAKAKIETIPLYVKSGSILPKANGLKNALQTLEKIDIYIYPGADGAFEMYDDEGTKYNYEKAEFVNIKFSWDDKSQKLTIGDREGEYPGMQKEIKFNVVKVGAKSSSYTDTTKAGKTVKYVGHKLEVQF